MNRQVCVITAVLVLVLSSIPVFANDRHSKQVRPESKPYQVVIVRHANRDGRKDRLNKRGKRRAERLASILEFSEIGRVHSTGLARTQATAAPAAAILGQSVEIYDDSQSGIATLVRSIRQEGGKHLVVGHSYTVNDTVGALGGQSSGDFGRKEYDRIYVLLADCTGEVNTLVLSFPRDADAIRSTLEKGLVPCEP